MTSNSSDRQRQALAALRLNWVMRPHQVWESFDGQVPARHDPVSLAVSAALQDAQRASDGAPLGIVVEGEAGAGKTHRLGLVREQVQQDGGYFFLVALTHGETFWESIVESLLDGLWRTNPKTGETQLQSLLTGLDKLAGASSRVFRAAIKGRKVTPQSLDMFIRRLSAATQIRPEVRDTARALTLYAAVDPDAQDIAKAYFLSADDLDPADRTTWGLRVTHSPNRIAEHILQLIGLVGHSVVALDQIEPLLARAAASAASVSNTAEDAGRDHLVNQIADGLMELQERSHRTLTLLTCVPNTWQLIRHRAVTAVADRFRTVDLPLIQDAEAAREIVERHLTANYRTAGFTPPYPTWPVAPAAFTGAEGYTPRVLLQLIDEHARNCLANGEIRELTDFMKADDSRAAPALSAPDDANLERLDRRFEELRTTADVSAALDPVKEDLVMPVLLRNGIAAWVDENGFSTEEYAPDPPPSSKPPLHAGLAHILDENTEREIHYAFRAICHPSPLAALHRLRSAITVSGIAADDDSRHLIILRTGDWSKGVRTQEAVADFVRRGGMQLDADPDELRTFDALGILMKEQDPALPMWLASRRPASRTELLRRALPPDQQRDAADETNPGSSGPTVTDRATPTSSLAPPSASPTIELGRTQDDNPIRLELESLRKHVAIFAGSGSGKTVLLRRLIEECALQGVSAVVLDPNNDLARLGDPWPQTPPGWQSSDPQKAAQYLDETDVVIWTPRRENGRPLTFQPLPDLVSVLDDKDEFRQAVDIAVSALLPKARALGRTTKAERQRAVLRQSVEYFAHHGGGSLTDLIDLMAELPPAASTITSAVTMAEDMSQTLTAAMVNDPLFGGRGTPVDPSALLTPAPGKKARISVISFVGLPDDEQRQSFVSQLQMALFSWFKRHPAGDRPLGGLLVMDEAQTVAPSGASTPSTQSTLILASQARKYGLGLVFATQAPKALHNRIPGNATTQFFGLLNSPSQIDAAKGLARDKGGDVSDIGRLTAGEFYVAVEGAPFQRARTYLCLSHHPRSPLTTDEVISRARQPLPD